VPSTLLFLAFAVVAFAGGWLHGRVTLDGTGQSLYLRLAVDQWRHTGHLSYWLPDMWAGTPIWSIAASLPVVVMLPVARLFGPDAAVKLGCLLGQVLGAFGAYWLARALWGRTWGAPLAGLFYGLSPIFISQSYFGVDRASIVIGLAPWFVWAFRRALRGEGRRAGLVAMVGAGLLAGVAVLEQAEQAYAFMLPVACLLPLELTRAARRVRAAARPAVRRVRAPPRRARRARRRARVRPRAAGRRPPRPQRARRRPARRRVSPARGRSSRRSARRRSPRRSRSNSGATA
jgi:hypothetical protein